MYHPLFLHILSKVENYDFYFVQTRNCVGILDLSSLQKVTMRI
jgi:hypothetical protein